MNTNHAVALLEDMIVAGGPTEAQYGVVASAIDVLHDQEFAVQGGLAVRKAHNDRFQALLQKHWSVFGTTASMQGFARLKPHGYSGDFEIIERIYNRTTSADPALSRWDAFFHNAPATEAVRNRAAMLGTLCDEHRPSSLLSVGCGPGLDVRPILQTSSGPSTVVLLDNDMNAISRAAANLSAYRREANHSLEFVCHNALRWRPNNRFDFIWSSGLFDYLNDKTAIFLLKRFLAMLEPGGHAVVGNFSHKHSSRSYVEAVGNWFLIHRSEEDMARMAIAAGFRPDKIEVRADTTGVNLFLVASA